MTPQREFVLFFPHYPKNPYQEILRQSLAKEGIEVHLADGRWRSILSFCSKYPARRSVYHIHWIHPFLKEPSRFLCGVRAAGFLLLFLGLKVRGSKLFWTVHNLYSHDLPHPGSERVFRSMLARIADGLFVHSASAVNAVSQEYGCPSAKITVIANPHYIDFYPNHNSREEARRKMNAAPDTFVLLYFGLIRAYKGLDLLIEAFQELGPQVQLVIAGYARRDDKFLQRLLKLAAKKPGIRIHPRFIKDEEVQDFFNACDAVALPFKKILNSGSLLLGMSFAKPCIVPAFEGVAAVVDEKSGFLYDPADPQGLKKKLQEAFLNRRLLAEKGRAAFEKAREKHAPAKIASIMARVYQTF